MSLFYNDEYQILKTRLENEIRRLEADRQCYNKLIEFLVVAEDHRYYHHPGFDIIGICRAIYRNLFQGKREGASTIEQQLVRLLTEDYRYSYKRKIKEIYLASKLKNLADKKTIAATYLTVANYGTDYQRLSGILRKFGKNIHQELDDEVCAEVVARLKYPEPRQINERRIVQIALRKQFILGKIIKKGDRHERR